MRGGALPFDSSSTYLFEIDLNRYDVSNSLNRDFIQKLVFGGHINHDLKHTVSDRLRTHNNYRGYMLPSFHLAHFPSSGRFGYLLSYRYTNLIDLEFSEDFFNLIFYGNSALSKRRQFLSNTHLKYQTYHSLSLGLVDKKSGSFLSLGIFDGIDFRDYQFGNSVFHTGYVSYANNEFSETVALQMSDSKFMESTRSYRPFKNGIGLGLNGAFNFKSGDHTFRISVKDLGIMHWKNVSSRDTSGYFQFNGFSYSPGGTE